MTLKFPNRSRSFDETRNAVRFIGHDSMVEVPFFIEAGALLTQDGTKSSAADCLAAFDAARGSVHDVAREAYSHARRTLYTLTAADSGETASNAVRYGQLPSRCYVNCSSN